MQFVQTAWHLAAATLTWGKVAVRMAVTLSMSKRCSVCWCHPEQFILNSFQERVAALASKKKTFL